MKVYRIVMEGTCYKPLSGIGRSSLESLYYEMGYILTGNKYHGSANNICDRIGRDDTGYYYFIFLEDALHFAVYTQKPAATLKIMEFDFPEDVVYSLIGWGGYHYADGYNYDKRAETYISDSKIDGGHVLTTNIEKKKKKKTFLDEFRRCNSVLKDYYDNHKYKIEYTIFNEKIAKLLELSDEELFDSYIKTKDYFNLSGGAYQQFLSTLLKFDAIQTRAITHRSSPVLFSLWDKKRGFERQELPEIAAYNEELLSKNGLAVDYSESGIACRMDYTKMIENKEYDNAKKLLKSYRR